MLGVEKEKMAKILGFGIVNRESFDILTRDFAPNKLNRVRNKQIYMIKKNIKI